MKSFKTQCSYCSSLHTLNISELGKNIECKNCSEFIVAEPVIQKYDVSISRPNFIKYILSTSALLIVLLVILRLTSNQNPDDEGRKEQVKLQENKFQLPPKKTNQDDVKTFETGKEIVQLKKVSIEKTNSRPHLTPELKRKFFDLSKLMCLKDQYAFKVNKNLIFYYSKLKNKKFNEETLFTIPTTYGKRLSYGKLYKVIHNEYYSCALYEVSNGNLDRPPVKIIPSFTEGTYISFTYDKIYDSNLININKSGKAESYVNYNNLLFSTTGELSGISVSSLKKAISFPVNILQLIKTYKSSLPKSDYKLANKFEIRQDYFDHKKLSNIQIINSSEKQKVENFEDCSFIASRAGYTSSQDLVKLYPISNKILLSYTKNTLSAKTLLIDQKYPVTEIASFSIERPDKGSFKLYKVAGDLKIKSFFKIEKGITNLDNIIVIGKEKKNNNFFTSSLSPYYLSIDHVTQQGKPSELMNKEKDVVVDKRNTLRINFYNKLHNSFYAGTSALVTPEMELIAFSNFNNSFIPLDEDLITSIKEKIEFSSELDNYESIVGPKFSNLKPMSSFDNITVTEIGSDGSRYRVDWETKEMKMVKYPRGDFIRVVKKNGKYIGFAFVNRNGTLYKFLEADGSILQELKVFNMSGSILSFSTDGNFLLATGNSKVSLISLSDFKVIRSVELYSKYCRWVESKNSFQIFGVDKDQKGVILFISPQTLKLTGSFNSRQIHRINYAKVFIGESYLKSYIIFEKNYRKNITRCKIIDFKSKKTLDESQLKISDQDFFKGYSFVKEEGGYTIYNINNLRPLFYLNTNLSLSSLTLDSNGDAIVGDMNNVLYKFSKKSLEQAE